MSFPRYPAYKDSGVEWLGEVPEHWSIVSVKAVATCNDEVLDESTAPDFDMEYVEISGVEGNSGVLESTSVKFSAAPSRARRKVRHGDVIVSTVRTYLRAIAAIKDPPENMIVSTGFAVVRPSLIDSGFLGYLFHAEYLIAEVISRSVGVSYPAINASVLMELKIPTPSFGEQGRISAFLDCETAKIDALVEDYRALIELLKEKRQATISHAVTKGLDPTVPMKDSGVEWLGEVPEHWRVVRLKFVATVQTGVAKGKDNSGKATTEVPYLRVANVQDGYLDLADIATIEIPEDDMERYTLRPGDVLMNEGGDYDKLGRGHVWEGEIAPCIHQNHVFAVRPSGVSSAWLNRITGSIYAQFYFMSRSKQSTNLASISSANIMELPVVLPSPVEREALAAFLDTETTRLNALVSDAEEAIALLQERRTALISAAVTGKIDVRGHCVETNG
jgi:type I restriction enzyme, S subunit